MTTDTNGHPASPAAKYMQQELSKAMQLVGTVPSRSGSVSDLSDHSDNESLIPPMGKGKSKRRTSVVLMDLDSSGTTTPVTPRVRSLTEESLPESEEGVDHSLHRGDSH